MKDNVREIRDFSEHPEVSNRTQRLLDFRVREWSLSELKGRRIWIPHMCDSAFILAAVLRSRGYDAEVLPRSSDSGFSLGREHTDGDQCLPSIITTEDILRRVKSGDFKEDKEAFFQGKSEGPCRFGRYYMNQQAILYDLGVNAPVFTFDNRNAYGGIGNAAKMIAWDGMVLQSLLERAMHFTRPYELKPKSEELYKSYLEEACRIIEESGRNELIKMASVLVGSHKRDLEELACSAAGDFSRVEKSSEKKPVIFVTGEIYVRTSDVANQELVKKIESLGGVALQEPAVSYFAFVFEMKYREAGWQDKRLKKAKLALEMKFMKRDEHALAECFQDVLGDFSHDPSGKTVMDLGMRYLHERHKGEAIVSLGASQYFAGKVDGVINTLPFNCLPGMLVKAMTPEFRRNNGNIPFLNLSYDGHADSNREEQLGVFMYQVRERMRKMQGV